MRKNDQIAYYVPVRRFGEFHREEVKGYCYHAEDEGDDFYFMIRKLGKGWQVEEYGTGLKVGGNYDSLRVAAANIRFMIIYHDLLGTIRRTHKIKLLRDGGLLNPGDPGKLFPSCIYEVPDPDRKEE